jgi:hypothetical protein
MIFDMVVKVNNSWMNNVFFIACKGHTLRSFDEGII